MDAQRHTRLMNPDGLFITTLQLLLFVDFCTSKVILTLRVKFHTEMDLSFNGL